jgi:hypothetical protein
MKAVLMAPRLRGKSPWRQPRPRGERAPARRTREWKDVVAVSDRWLILSGGFFRTLRGTGMRVVKSILGAGAILAATTANASAQTCWWIFCWGGGGGGGGTTPSAPEIDATQGLAALAILACAVLFLRERFLRERAAS